MSERKAEPILVSSCLLGLPTRYDGRCKTNSDVRAFLQRHNLVPIPVCPEQLAGLPTPRPRTRFTRGDGRALLNGAGEVRDDRQQPVSDLFLKGAGQTLAIARLCGCRRAILKERSPSCGSRLIYLEERVVPGMGVAAALLERHGIELWSEENLPEG
ncbi:DUF523 domain-containing protein [Geothermobacter hydrogeniphilus]|uniref:DUF523 domain-containing protein n=1 Tax=Geothermobacter hydrogeniphilus TaxID=1969733 RepID=A0A2K2HC99_9BACT|nr:DUF523 domain-containing protein [Geothermobacter hydrogeniphilus]PNU20945.1 DUF523 domain-containing protein [Geothermobacter hydrogeniphilus]